MNNCYDSNANPLITVIIPNYNGEQFLNTCLRSVQKQTYQPLEVIVADDASEDNSISIAKHYEHMFTKFKIIKRETNLGLAKNKHDAINNSNGSFVTTLDSDDFYWNSQKLQYEYDIIKRYNAHNIYNIIPFSHIVTVAEDDSKIKSTKSMQLLEGDIFFKLLTRRLPFIPRDFLMSRDQYYEAGGFDKNTKLYVDWYLKLKLAAFNKFYCADIEGIAYRQHHNTRMSAASFSKHFRWIKYCFDNNVYYLNFFHKFLAYILIYYFFMKKFFLIQLRRFPYLKFILKSLKQKAYFSRL